MFVFVYVSVSGRVSLSLWLQGLLGALVPYTHALVVFVLSYTRNGASSALLVVISYLMRAFTMEVFPACPC